MPKPGDAAKTIEFSIRHAEAQRAAHYLTLVHGVAVRRPVPITSSPLVLGRDPVLSFHLPDADVSRTHCSLRIQGDEVPRDKHGLVDLSEVTFLASMGIRMLIAAARTIDRRGKRLVLIAPRPLVDQALRHSSIDDIIPVAPDLEGALALLGA